MTTTTTTKRMLINATQKEELRVALIDGSLLYDLDIERIGRVQKKASIYKGYITRVEPSLDAAFVDYGAERHGFLPLKEVTKDHFRDHGPSEQGRPNIRDILKPGQELIIQVDKEERGNKGAALTTFIGLAGSYLVLMPNNPRAGGISRRIEGEDRTELKDVLSQLSLPEGMGLIIRTAGVGRNIEELQWDLDVLLNQWQAILQASQARAAPFLIHRENDVITRALRDYLRSDITEVLVDTEVAYEHAKEYIRMIRPDFAERIKLYQDPIPLFNRFQIESQIESAFRREIALDNGASIAIDSTEALIAIDINSARATEGSDIEETALQTNLAAAKEIARQLRLRDIGGLIVIDFIDMVSARHQRMVETHLREELQADRARVQLGRISRRFGLLEMSRQRLRPSLGDSTHTSCPRCDGQGTIRTVQSLALALIRVIEEEAMKKTKQVNVQVPIALAAYLLNEKRDTLVALEQRYKARILVLPNPHLETPHYEVSAIREGDTSSQEEPSYKLIQQPQQIKTQENAAKGEERIDEPAIKPFSRLPSPGPASDQGLIRRLWSAVFGNEKTTVPVTPTTSSTETKEPRTGAGKPHQHNRRPPRERSQTGHSEQQQQRHHNNRRGGAPHGRNRRNTGNRPHHRQQRPHQDRGYERHERAQPPAEAPEALLPPSPPPASPTPAPAVVAPMPPMPTPKPVADATPPSKETARKAHSAAANATSFLKLTPQEQAASLVTLNESREKAPSQPTPTHLTQIVTKKPTEEEKDQ